MSATVSSVFTTTQALGCLPVQVPVSGGLPPQLGLALAVSFAAALILGAVLATICAWFLCKNKSFDQRDEPGTRLSTGIDDKDRKTYSDYNYKNQVGLMVAKKRQLGTDSAEVLQLISVTSLKPKYESSRGLFDILALQSESDATIELSNQEMLAVANIEADMTEERLNMMMLYIKGNAEQLLRKDRITSAQYHSIVLTLFDTLFENVALKEREKTKQEEIVRLRVKDPDVQALEMNKIHSRYIYHMNSIAEDVKRIFRQELNTLCVLSDDELDSVMRNLTANMARHENKIDADQLQQLLFSYKLTARRNNFIELYRLSVGDQNSDIVSRQAAMMSVLKELAAEQMLTEKQRLQLTTQYTDTLKVIQKKNDDDFLRNVAEWQSKLSAMHREKLFQWYTARDTHRLKYMRGSSRVNGTNELVDTYHELLQQIRGDWQQMISDMDQYDAKIIDSLLKERGKTWQADASDADARMKDLLISKTKLTERKVDKCFRIFPQELLKQQRMRELKKGEIVKDLNDQLREQLKNVEREQRKALKEQQTIMDRQEAHLDNLLGTQIGLNDDSVKAISKGQQQSLAGVKNQVFLNKQRWNKIKEYRLNVAKRRLTDLLRQMEQFDAEDEGRDKKLSKQQEKQKLQLNKDINIEDAKVTDIARKFTTVMDEQVMLALEDAFYRHNGRMAQLIGQVIASHARSMAARQTKQHDSDEKLENEMLEKLASVTTSGNSERELNAVLKEHYSNVKGLIEQLNESRQRQEDISRQKLESNSVVAERRILEKQREDSESLSRHHRQTSTGTTLGQLEHLMLIEKNQQLLLYLETKIAEEMEAAKEEIDENLSSELVQQLKEEKRTLFAQVAVITKVPKAEIDEIIETAVTELGGSEKDASKLAKETRLEIQRMKRELDDGFPLHRAARTRRASVPTRQKNKSIDVELESPGRRSRISEYDRREFESAANNRRLAELRRPSTARLYRDNDHDSDYDDRSRHVQRSQSNLNRTYPYTDRPGYNESHSYQYRSLNDSDDSGLDRRGPNIHVPPPRRLAFKSAEI